MTEDVRAAVVCHFDSLDEVLTMLGRDVVADEMRNLFPKHGKYEYLWTADGSLIPSIISPFSSPFIYRGQTERHRPCLPGVFRGLSIGDQRGTRLGGADAPSRARLFIERVKLEEFILALIEHPAVGYANEIGLRLDPFALAQHYELATDRLDLTQDHMVAAFFASNQLVGEQWLPAEDGLGVIYRAHTMTFWENMPQNLACIGTQTLPRPGEQKAFTLRLPLGYDFERLPVEIFTFQQRKSCGIKLNERFNGGASLFPPDVMADVATMIRSEKTIPRAVADWLLSYDEPSREMLGTSQAEYDKFVAEHSDVRVSERDRIVLTEAHQETALKSLRSMKEHFLKGVGAIAVCNATTLPEDQNPTAN